MAFAAFVEMITIPEFAAEFLSNIGMTFLFSILGVIGQIVTLFNNSKRTTSIQ